MLKKGIQVTLLTYFVLLNSANGSVSADDINIDVFNEKIDRYPGIIESNSSDVIEEDHKKIPKYYDSYGDYDPWSNEMNIEEDLDGNTLSDEYEWTGQFQVGDESYFGRPFYETINGKQEIWPELEDYHMGVSPYIDNGKMYIPVRYLGYANGIRAKDIKWDKKTKKVTLLHHQKYSVEITIGSKIVYYNGKPKEIEAVAQYKDGRVFLPLRGITELLGNKVVWSAKLKTANINMLSEEIYQLSK